MYIYIYIILYYVLSMVMNHKIDVYGIGGLHFWNFSDTPRLEQQVVDSFNFPAS